MTCGMFPIANAEPVKALRSLRSLVARYEELTEVQELVRGYRNAQKRAGTGANPRLNVWAGPDLLRHDEVSLCRVLAWFLNPHESHDVGDRFLGGFLSKLVGLKGSQMTWSGTVEVSREYRQCDSRIDILIKLPALMVGIEAKVRSTASLEQLRRYRKEFHKDKGFLGVLLVRCQEDVDPAVLRNSGFRQLLWSEVEEWLREEGRELSDFERTDELPLLPNPALVGFLASNFADAIDKIYEGIRA